RFSSPPKLPGVGTPWAPASVVPPCAFIASLGVFVPSMPRPHFGYWQAMASGVGSATVRLHLLAWGIRAVDAAPALRILAGHRLGFAIGQERRAMSVGDGLLCWGVKSEHNEEFHTPALSAGIAPVSTTTASSGIHTRPVQNCLPFAGSSRRPLFIYPSSLWKKGAALRQMGWRYQAHCAIRSRRHTDRHPACRSPQCP